MSHPDPKHDPNYDPDPYGHAQEWREEDAEEERERKQANRRASLHNLPPYMTTDPGEFEEEEGNYWGPRGPDRKED